MKGTRGTLGLLGIAIGILLIGFSSAGADDWPMFGRDATRNAVSHEKDPPIAWDIGGFDQTTRRWLTSSAKNIRWVARLGTMTCGDPVVSDGLGRYEQSPLR